MLDMRFFRNPAFSTGTGGMILVFLAMSGVMFLITQYFQLVLGYSPLSAALRFLPMAPIMIIVSTLTPRLTERVRLASESSRWACCSSRSVCSCSAASAIDTQYLYVLACIVPLVAGMALVMSPMTAAIMSAVPARRAGAGSAMNDATRELGCGARRRGARQHRGIALHQRARAVRRASSRPTRRPRRARRCRAPCRRRRKLPAAAGRALEVGADQAFIGGIHLAVTVGAVLAVIAAIAVLRYLPAHIAPEGAMHGPLASAEEALELGLGGVPPAFPDTVHADGELDEVGDLVEADDNTREPATTNTT